MAVTTVEIKVAGISCQHCVKAITAAINQLSGIHQVEVLLDQSLVRVAYDGAETKVDQIKATIKDAGYEVAE